jgi:lysophospholipase L1-like esterase
MIRKLVLNRWAPIADQLKEGDYVFIQFGHNDEVKEKVGRYTTPDEFKNNLKKFITETRNRNAIPILLTPVARRQFDKDGNVMETHAQYSPLVREVARDTNTPLIDLDTKSRDLLQQFGEETSKLLFLHLQLGEHPNYPEGKTDNTHFSELGARKIAQIVLAEIVALRLELAGRIVNKDKLKTP